MKFYSPMLVIVLTTGVAHARNIPDLQDIDGDGLISSEEAQQAIEAAGAAHADSADTGSDGATDTDISMTDAADVADTVAADTSEAQGSGRGAGFGGDS